jgi:hypothetical protein
VFHSRKINFSGKHILKKLVSFLEIYNFEF